jgi:hypothetical protein
MGRSLISTMQMQIKYNSMGYCQLLDIMYNVDKSVVTHGVIFELHLCDDMVLHPMFSTI